MNSFLGKIIGDLGDKRRWREYRARANALPEPYRAALDALERYLLYHGAIAKGDVLVRMSEDLVDLFEQSAADGTPLRAVIGEDPVSFAETFLANYSDGQWINKERARLVEAIDRLTTEDERS